MILEFFLVVEKPEEKGERGVGADLREVVARAVGADLREVVAQAVAAVAREGKQLGESTSVTPTKTVVMCSVNRTQQRVHIQQAGAVDSILKAQDIVRKGSPYFSRVRSGD